MSVKQQQLFLLAVIALAFNPIQGAEHPSIHTVVPVECTDGYFEWQVIGLAYRWGDRIGFQPSMLHGCGACVAANVYTCPHAILRLMHC